MSAHPFTVVRPDADGAEPTPAEFERHCIESLTRESVRRRAWLRAELASEELRLTFLRKRLAVIRGVAFIRAESLEAEFKLGIHQPRQQP